MTACVALPEHPCDLVRSQRAPLPRVQSQCIQPQSTHRNALQHRHRIAGGGEHAAHLVVAAFGDGEAGVARAEGFKLCGGERSGFAVQQQRAGGKQCGFVAAQVLRELGVVDLGDARFRRDDPVQQLAIVGEQQQAGGVAVQPPDGGERRVEYRWHPNPAWDDLRFELDVIDGVPKTIIRSGSRFERGGNEVYIWQREYFIRAEKDGSGEVTGWRWYDRSGPHGPIQRSARFTCGSLPAGIGTQHRRVLINRRCNPSINNLREDVMKLTPLHDRVIIKRLEEEKVSAGGIVIPDSATEKPIRGEVIAVGEGKPLDNGQVRKLQVKAGDTVLFGKYSGTEVKVDGTEYLVVREDDLFAIIG